MVGQIAKCTCKAIVGAVVHVLVPAIRGLVKATRVAVSYLIAVTVKFYRFVLLPIGNAVQAVCSSVTKGLKLAGGAVYLWILVPASGAARAIVKAFVHVVQQAAVTSYVYVVAPIGKGLRALGCCFAAGARTVASAAAHVARVLARTARVVGSAVNQALRMVYESLVLPVCRGVRACARYFRDVVLRQGADAVVATCRQLAALIRELAVAVRNGVIVPILKALREAATVVRSAAIEARNFLRETLLELFRGGR